MTQILLPLERGINSFKNHEDFRIHTGNVSLGIQMDNELVFFRTIKAERPLNSKEVDETHFLLSIRSPAPLKALLRYCQGSESDAEAEVLRAVGHVTMDAASFLVQVM